MYFSNRLFIGELKRMEGLKGERGVSKEREASQRGETRLKWERRVSNGRDASQMGERCLKGERGLFIYQVTGVTNG